MSLSTERLEHLSKVYREGLLNDIVPFWIKNGIDNKHGGIMTCMDRQGNIIDTDKGVWQQGRFAWMLGYLYNTVEQNPEWLHHMKHTIEFMEKHCFDPADGRMYFHVAQDGTPIRKRRYAYSEAFACIAFGEYAKATGREEYAEKARKTYAAYGNHVVYPPKFTDARPSKGMGHPMIDIVTCQRLRDSIGFEDANNRIDAAIEEIHKYFMKYDIECCMETVGLNGEIIDHIDGRTLNPGHAIEGAWFIMREGQIRNNPEYIKIGLTILDWMWERGWDKQYGGILYYRDVYNKPVSEYWQDMKFWWPHNEVIIATLLAYQLTGDEKYAKWHTLAHDWTYSHFPDAECGDWYGYLSRSGRVCSEIKGNLYKGCFHAPRQALEAWKIADQLLKK